MRIGAGNVTTDLHEKDGVNAAAATVEATDLADRREPDNRQSHQVHPVTEVSIQQETSFLDARLSMLLHLVEETHSVPSACKFALLPLTTAQDMLHHAELVLGYPLIVSGDTAGNRSTLTPRGRMLLMAYDRLSEDIQRIACALYDQYFGDFPDLQI